MRPLVLLVNPSYTERVYKIKESPSGIRPPLGLAYIAAYLEQAGVGAEILDANAEFLSPQETAERIIRSPARYVGFTSVTITIPLICEISSLVKKKDNSKFIFIGGPHVTFMAKQTLKDCSGIDLIVRGEGELTAVELIKSLEEGGAPDEIKGITFRKGKEIMENADRGLIEDIDAIPFPARHLLSRNLYSVSYLTNLGIKNSQCDSMITARGCPNKCVFCSSSFFWKMLRIRSAENVVAELERLIKNYNVRYIDFLDDTINASKERIKKICYLMIEKKMNIKWSCYARVNNITPELVDLMKKAGCCFVQFGVESGNQKVLDRVQKNITLEQIQKAVKIVKKFGIKLMCDFMLGLPGDTKETINQTIEFAKELNPNFAFFSITTPFPGTALYKEYRSLGRLEDGYIWQNMSLHERTDFSTPTLTSEELQSLYVKAHREFYYRRGFFWHTLKWIIRHPYEIKNFYSLAKLQITREFRDIFK